MHGLHLLGETETEVGFDFASFAQTAGNIAQAGSTMYEQKKASDAASSSEQKKLATSIAADIAAATALAKAASSKAQNLPTASSDDAAAQSALASTDTAAAGLSPDSQQKRAAAADAALANAQKNAANKPSDPFLPMLVNAWTTVGNKVHNAAITGGAADAGAGGKHGKHDEESWFSRPVIGSLPGAAVLVLGAGVVGGLVYVVKKVLGGGKAK
jgi:hypothetical protein